LIAKVADGTENNSFCGVHLITARDFNGKMGVAWTNELCSHHDGHMAGITTTIVDDGSVSSFPQHLLSFTHELGHLFGSTHDDQRGVTECNPIINKFLMHSSTSSLDGSPNAEIFSPCSKAEMLAGISKNGNCLTPIKEDVVPFTCILPTTPPIKVFFLVLYALACILIMCLTIYKHLKRF